MQDFVNALANGVSLGSLYALMSLGFVIIFRATSVLNFAHGAFLLLGIYVAAIVSEDHGFLPGVLAGLAAGAAAGVVVEVVFVRHAHSRDPVSMTILTLGLNLLVVTEIGRRLGSNTLHLNDPWGDSVVHLGAVVMPQSRLAALVLAAVIIGAFMLVFRFTHWGLAMRVSSQDSEVAALMGVRLSRVSWVSWAIGGVLATLSGLFLASYPSAGVTAALGDTAIRAFPAAVIGGLNSVGGALVGGMILGLAESFAATYQGALGPLGNGLSGVIAYIVLFVVLLIKPEGLFGRKEVTRV